MLLLLVIINCSNYKKNVPKIFLFIEMFWVLLFSFSETC